MPKQVAEVTANPLTGALPRKVYVDACLIDYVPTEEEPPTGFNTPRLHTSPVGVADDFGDGSDIHNASKMVRSMGAEQWHSIVLEAESKTEVLGNSDTEVTATGIVTDVPMAGDLPVEVTVDGQPMNVVDTVTSPPSSSTTEPLPPAAEEALVNRDTGEIVPGTESSGAAQGIEVTYYDVDWTEGLRALEQLGENHNGIDLLALSDMELNRAHIGDLDELSTWAGGQRVYMPIMYQNGAGFPRAEDGRDLAIAIGQYVPSKNLLPISHESPDDLAATVLGQAAINVPWFDVFFDGDGYPVALPGTSRYSRLIGKPGQIGTFEDGADGSGPSNVLMRKEGVPVLSNSLTTAGLASDYRYWDVPRTESMLIEEIEDAVDSLRLREDFIGFNRFGKAKLYQALYERLGQYEADEENSNLPLNYFTIHIPDAQDLPMDDRANRLWSGIIIQGQIAGNLHRAAIDFRLLV